MTPDHRKEAEASCNANIQAAKKQRLKIRKAIIENGQEWSQLHTEMEQLETELHHSREQLISQGIVQRGPSQQQVSSRDAMQED